MSTDLTYVVPQRRSPDSAAPRAHGGESAPSFSTLSELSADEVSLLVRVFCLISSAALEHSVSVRSDDWP